jgi:hypothetical protein
MASHGSVVEGSCDLMTAARERRAANGSTPTNGADGGDLNAFRR